MAFSEASFTQDHSPKKTSEHSPSRITISLEKLRVALGDLRSIITNTQRTLGSETKAISLNSLDEIEDLSAFAELVEDPIAEERISQTNEVEIGKMEASLIQELKGEAQKTDILAHDVERLAHSISLEGTRPEEQARAIYSALKKRENGQEALQAITSPKLGQLVWEHIEPTMLEAMDPLSPWDADAHFTLATYAEQSSYIKEAFKKFLRSKFSPLYEEKLLDATYIKELREMQTILQTESYEGIKLCDQTLPLSSVMAAREIFGSSQQLQKLCQALDIGKHVTGYTRTKDQSILSIQGASFTKKGFTAHINTEFSLERGDLKHQATISRGFALHEWLDEHQEKRRRLDVHHESFSLPKDVQNAGVAKQVLHDSFAWYFEQEKHGLPITDVLLLANNDVGGYAWSTYGFDWDKERMTRAQRILLQKQIPTQKNLSDEQVWEAALATQLDECKTKLLLFLNEVRNISSTERQSLLEPLSAALEDCKDPRKRDLITPQYIATLGKNKPHFVLVDDGKGIPVWKREPMEDSVKILKRYHLGKVATLGTSWYAKLALQPRDEGEKSHLNLLTQRLEL